jgi:hypothetical protein
VGLRLKSRPSTTLDLVHYDEVVYTVVTSLCLYQLCFSVSVNTLNSISTFTLVLTSSLIVKMENVYNKALAGTLTAHDLKDDKVLNYVNPTTNLTLLGAAVWYGHIDQVKLLLKNGADPNGEGSRPPLWVAASKTGKNAGRIIQILLNNKADPNLPSKIDSNSTPLLRAVKTYKPPAIISALVDAGASPTIADDNADTPEKLATTRKDRDRLRAMLPRNERTGKRLPALLMLSGFLLFTVAWANTNVVVATTATAVAGGGLIAANAVKKRFGMSGRFDSNIEIVCSPERSRRPVTDPLASHRRKGP